MDETLNAAFEALKIYDWGQDPKVLAPIYAAIRTSRGDDAARRQIEERLAAVLAADAPYDARQMACRLLMLAGSAACVPALSALLADEKLAHMARFALERIPAPEAGRALCDALPKVKGSLKVGMISSLGSRGDEAGVSALQALLGDTDAAVAGAAAQALGAIGSPGADKALAAAAVNTAAKDAVAHASLVCAERLLAAGNKAGALAAYARALSGSPSETIREAAERGKTACGGA